ncbi:putative pectinesterase/pectinesterase inhibitor 51 [Apostasia shenzhenica]|uniref:Pectinesterase n=1 Tax=Apostasia shenzhenica TaxID=1088818 RepID=A0A2I0AG76_9ASPA|nr:putative pectinesterase/pectinesterase inhibitor 51 [Apostasia shenzhenica]
MHHRRPSKPFPPFLLLFMASLLLSLLLFLFLLPPSQTGGAAPSSSPAIRNACRATRFPSSCEPSLSQSPSLPSNPSAANLIDAALSVSASALPTAQSMAESILSASSSNPDRATAARNCLDDLSLSARRLSAAAAAVGVANSHAFAGAALLYQYDCWSALKYVNSTRQVAAAMSFLDSLYALTSNALAMIAALRRFGPDVSLWAPPQTERDGYWGDLSSTVAAEGGGGLFRLHLVAAPDLTVCPSGECDHRTVQEAVNAAPDYGLKRFTIFIKAGIYRETVRIPFEKTNIAFVGEGIGRTVITGDLNAEMSGISTYNTATVGVAGDGFVAANLTFENSAGPKAHQAVAFLSDSDHSILESVEFAGHQDTLYARSLRQLYRNCRISGTVDFIFGNSATIFENCDIKVVPRQESPEKGESNAVTAHGRTDPGQPTGFVFKDCIVNGSDEYVSSYRRKSSVHRVYLGRPWKEYSRTVFLNCYLEEIVRPEGWLPWRGEFALATLFYGEYESSGPGANSTARVSWSSRIPAEHVGIYSLENFIQGGEWVTGE